MQRNPQQVRDEQEAAHAGARSEDRGVRPFQNLDEAGKSAANYTVELAVAPMQARAMNPGKLPSEAFGETSWVWVLVLRLIAGGQTWLTLEHVSAPDAPITDSLYPVAARFSLFYHDVAVAAGDEPPSRLLPDARRFVPRDFRRMLCC